MPVVEPAIRPPAEAGSFLLQLTLGCSANGCAFCGAYVGKPFAVKDPAEVEADIAAAARRHPDTRRVFLMDGDAFTLSTDRLVPLLDRLAAAFPRLARVAAYTNDYSILGKTDDELALLREKKLSLVYVGLESGDQGVLTACGKRSTVEGMVAAVRRAAAAGIKSSVIVLLGLGGRDGAARHIALTAAALNRMQPRYLSLLSLMLVPGTELHRRAQAGAFTEQSEAGLLRETRDLVAGLDLAGTVFRTDHASNWLPLEGRFPQDKARLLEVLDGALDGRIALKPAWLRGL